MKNLYKAIFAVQKAIEPMKKTGKNAQQGYAYFSEAQVSEKVREEFDKNGLIFIPTRIENKETREIEKPDRDGNAKVSHLAIASVTWIIAHADSGEAIEGTTENTALDTSDKAMNKAITAAVKYLFMKMFHISTGDDLEDDRNEKAPAYRNIDTEFAPAIPSVTVGAPACPVCRSENRASKEGSYGPYWHCNDCGKNEKIK